MVIRQARSDEAAKIRSLHGVAFKYKTDPANAEPIKNTVIGAYLDDGETLMACMSLIDYKTVYCGNVVGAVGIAGVASYPQYRRHGCIRALFMRAFETAAERGWAMSYLYPFSFRYYRKFGYERIVQHKTMTFTFDMLSHIPRECDARLYNGSDADKAELLAMYNRFALGENCMIYRDDMSYLPSDPFGSQTLVYIMNDGSGYAAVKPTDGNQTLEVSELVYSDPASLKEIFGFLRTFEGQYKKIYLPFLELDSPVEYLLDTDRMCGFGMYDGAMGRVIDIGAALKLNKYPDLPGSFSFEVTGDVIAANNAVWDVEYAGGRAVSVAKRTDGEFDFSADICTASRLLFGEVPEYGLDFLPGLTVRAKRDLLAACFPKRRLLMYDRF